MTSSARSEGVFCLLELPAELRLIIYKYALQAPNGVACESVWDSDKCFFRFFPLLCPIRDLSLDLFHMENASSQAVVCSTTEVNQIRYVCRQLNIETEGLTMSVNELIFKEGILESIDFFQACSSALLERLRVVTVMSSELCWDHEPASKDTRNAIISLRELCTRFTQVTVRLRHEYLHPEEFGVLRHALGFKIYLRNEATLVDQLSNNAEEQAIVLADIATSLSHREVEKFPTNLRVYPPFAEFDEQDFVERVQEERREMIEEDADEDTETSGEESEEATEMIAKVQEQGALIKKIFEDGI